MINLIGKLICFVIYFVFSTALWSQDLSGFGLPALTTATGSNGENYLFFIITNSSFDDCSYGSSIPSPGHDGFHTNNHSFINITSSAWNSTNATQPSPYSHSSIFKLLYNEFNIWNSYTLKPLLHIWTVSFPPNWHWIKDCQF